MSISEIVLEKNIPCKVRDGITLYADVYRPNDDGEYPVLLSRLPYGKDSPFYSHRYLDTNKLVRNGYVVIIQDVRGRYNSEGIFDPFKHEAEDGYDTVEWAAQLPYSNGEVGMFGMSFYGYTQLLAATLQPPHLKAIFPTMTVNGREEEGVFLLAQSLSLDLESFAPDLLKRKYQESNPEKYEKKMAEWLEYYNNVEDWYSYKPLIEWPPLKNLNVDSRFLNSIDDDRNAELTEAQFKEIIFDKYSEFDIPAVHFAGWYDNLLLTTLENFTEMKTQSKSEKVRKSQRLVIGPWTHGFFGSIQGERFFGMDASEYYIDQQGDFTDIHLNWFDYWLKGKDSFDINEPPVKIFIMGFNEWRDEYEWPLERTQYTPFYLHSDGNANTRSGDGRLSFEKPGDEKPDLYTYDPENPVPTHGGPIMYPGSQFAGPRDQRIIEERDDVLVYSSEPLEQPVEVTGPVTVKLWAKTDCIETDFTAKLVDVLPDGTAYNIAEGIMRTSTVKQDVKNEVYFYEIDLWATSNVFLKGHQIRLEVSSSNFPRFDPNLNNGKSVINSSQSTVAQQTIYHNEVYPSHIILPIIPSDD